jgi:hypothetical protein
MRKGLIRRVAGRGRRGRSVGSGSGSTITDATGKRYRFVPVNETDEAAFADPPRRWGRVGILAGGWAIILALGATVAPGFAASGDEDNVDARDQEATDAVGAAWSYLKYGSDNDPDRAQATLCDDASPEQTPADLDDIRQTYDDQLGGIERIDLDIGDPMSLSEGIVIPGEVIYIYQGHQRHEDFLVTVQENDGTYCVSNAVQVQEEEPSASDDTSDGATSEAVDPQELAADFMRTIVIDREPQAAAALQCPSFTGITAEDLDAAIAEWSSTNGSTTGYLNSLEPAETSESSITMFDVEVRLDGELNIETFAFSLGVQGNCVASLEGGEGLIDP